MVNDVDVDDAGFFDMVFFGATSLATDDVLLAAGADEGWLMGTALTLGATGDIVDE